ncbi:hypothetical protein ACIPRI_09090 [Variovorax sp. LARHSF232]
MTQKRDASKQPAIDEALEKNKQVAEDIKEAADDLLVVHEVLEKGLSDKAPPQDVEQAVAHTGDIEKKLSESAETLDEINQALERAATQGKRAQEN